MASTKLMIGETVTSSGSCPTSWRSPKQFVPQLTLLSKSLLRNRYFSAQVDLCRKSFLSGGLVPCKGLVCDVRRLRESRKKGLTICANAYEAEKSDVSPDGSPHAAMNPTSAPTVNEGARRVKIGIYFATWWSLNVIFNIYNKKVLNAFPYPWLTSTLSLAAGSAIMLASWATRLVEAPDVDLDFWKGLAPVRNEEH